MSETKIKGRYRGKIKYFLKFFSRWLFKLITNHLVQFDLRTLCREMSMNNIKAKGNSNTGGLCGVAWSSSEPSPCCPFALSLILLRPTLHPIPSSQPTYVGPAPGPQKPCPSTSAPQWMNNPDASLWGFKLEWNAKERINSTTEREMLHKRWKGENQRQAEVLGSGSLKKSGLTPPTKIRRTWGEGDEQWVKFSC